MGPSGESERGSDRRKVSSLVTRGALETSEMTDNTLSVQASLNLSATRPATVIEARAFMLPLGEVMSIALTMDRCELVGSVATPKKYASVAWTTSPAPEYQRVERAMGALGTARSKDWIRAPDSQTVPPLPARGRAVCA